MWFKKKLIGHFLIETDARVDEDKEYPAPDWRLIVAVLPRLPTVSSVRVTVAVLAPLGIVNRPDVPLSE